MITPLTLAFSCVLALVIGVLLGRFYVPAKRGLVRAARQAESYARALNHTLEDQPDDAVEALRRVVAEDTDDLEPYFALGALFRRRGEWERAVRVHQAIAMRDPKNKAIQGRAHFALGRDFTCAGMPRRATRAFEQCLVVDGKHQPALRALVALYEEQGRYAEAADALARLDKLREQGPSARGHHLLVAAAQSALRGPAADLDHASRLLRDARRGKAHSVHALVAEAELAAAHRDPEAACEHLLDAVELAPELAAFLLPGLIEAQRQSMRRERGDSAELAVSDEAAVAGVAAKLAERLATSGRSDEPFAGMALAELRSHCDPEAALADYRDLAERFPDLLPAQVAAARLALAAGDEGEIRDALRRLSAADGVLAWAMEGAWRCSGCGHRQDLFFWRCPACRAWGSVRLELGREALAPPPPPPWDEPALVRGGVDAALSGAAARRTRASAMVAAGASASHQAAPWIDASSGSSRSASLWSRVGAWFGGVGASQAPAEPVAKAPAGAAASPRPSPPATVPAWREDGAAADAAAADNAEQSSV